MSDRPGLVLRDIADPVVCVMSTAPWEEVVVLFKRTGAERAIALDGQHNPVGLVRAHRLLLALPEPTQFRSAENAITLQQLDILEPIKIVPATWSVSRIRDVLLPDDTSPWVVMDEQGTCVGLVNRLRLYDVLLQRALSRQTGNGVALSEVEAVPPPASVQPQVSDGRVQSPPLVSQPALSQLQAIVGQGLEGNGLQDGRANLPQLNALLELLPLPLMVQTGEGQVLAHNQAWRSHLGTLSADTAIQCQTAPSLKTLLMAELTDSNSIDSNSDETPPTATINPERDRPETSELLHTTTSTWGEFLQTSLPDPTAPAAALTQRYACLYSVGDREERVWQVAYMPLSADAERVESAELNGMLARRSPLSSAADSTATSAAESAAPLWLVVAQDITEHQQVARELAAKNADLMQLNRLKDEFLACISHELKTPLTAILGLSSLLKNQLVGDLNERQSRYAGLIHQSGRHLMMVVNDILDVTRIETGQLELSLETIDVPLICRQSVDQARQNLNTSGNNPHDTPSGSADHRVHLQIQSHLSPLTADAARLRQMLSNLLANAIKFTLSDGDIGLRVDQWDDWMAFTVWDTGIGIPHDKQHLIFQKFQQLESPLTRRFEGTGLGLVLTQRLARLHGGDVTFISNEGKGSEFTLLLPQHAALTRPRLAATQGRTTQRQLSSRQLVLLVDTAPHLLDEMTHLLTQAGYQVAIARTGTEALEKARCLQPLAIFLNPLLPALSGWDVLTLLQSDAETQLIPVVVMASRAERSRALSRGASNFLNLPIDPEALQQTLDDISRQVVASDAPSRPAQLTVLHLCPQPQAQPIPAAAVAQSRSVLTPPDRDNSPLLTDLAGMLHPYPCRVLEVNDLEQAELLAQVWQPQVLLVDGVLPKPVEFMKLLSHCPNLTALPLVTFSQVNTQAAIQFRELAVYPCVALTWDVTGLPATEVQRLRDVLETAAGLRK